MKREIDILITDWGLREEYIQAVICKFKNLNLLNIVDVLRHEMMSESKLSGELNSTIKRGDFLSELQIEKVILKWTDQNNDDFLLYKYPRTINQYKSLIKFLKKDQIEIGNIWHFKIKNLDVFKESFFNVMEQRLKVEKYGDETVLKNWITKEEEMLSLVQEMKQVSESSKWKTVEHQFSPHITELELLTIVENCS